jgi:hypothetical protein
VSACRRALGRTVPDAKEESKPPKLQGITR